MTKDSTRPGSTSTRGRVKYAAQACDVCRKRKIKCDGQKPTCEPCINSGREDECSWHGEPVRRPRTEAHFQAMRSRLKALRDYAMHLESLLQMYRKEFNGTWDTTYLTRRPQDVDFSCSGDDNECDLEVDEELVDESDPIYQICRSTSGLKLLDGGYLAALGNTAVYRFAPEVLPVSRFCPTAEQAEPLYTLLVEGVEETEEMLNIDWARYLPEGQPLSRRVHDKLLDLLFRFVTCYCLRVIPPLFLRDMWRTLSTPLGQPPPKAPHYSPMLHNALLAVASCFCDEPEVYETARDLFAAKAKSYLDEEADHPRISLVHSLSMLSAYHSSRGEQMLGYLYFGMSARISQALGVGIDCSDWVKNQLIEEHDRLDRNWVHWTTLNQDVCWSLYVGRDLSCQVPSNLRGIPVPYVDADFDEQPWVYPPSGLAPQPNNLLKTFAATCQLLLIARRIMDVVNKLNAVPTRPEVIDDIVSSIDLQLNTWKRDLCPEVEITSRTRAVSTPHRLVIHMNYWWLFILLHRPFYNRQIRPSRSGCTSNIDHIKLCKRSAENIMELLATYRSLYGLRYIPISVVQVVFATGTVWLLVAVQATVGVRMAKEAFKRAYAQAQLCITYLEEMGRSWKCASDVADIFKQLMFEKLKRWLDRGTLIGDADDNNPSKRSLSCSPVTKFACIRSSAAPSSPQGSISSPRTDSRDSTPSDQISSGSLKHSSSLPVIDSQFQSGQNLWYTHPAQIPSTVTSPTMMFGQPMVPVSHETLSHTSALNGQSYSGSVNSMQSTYSVADYVAAQQMYQPIQPSPFDDPSMDFLFSLTFDGSDSTSNYQRAMRCGMTLFGHPVVPVNTLTTDTPITDANAYRNIFGVDMVSEPQQHGGDRIMSDVSSGDVDMQHPGQRSSTSESLHMPPMNFANRGFFI